MCSRCSLRPGLRGGRGPAGPPVAVPRRPSVRLSLCPASSACTAGQGGGPEPPSPDSGAAAAGKGQARRPEGRVGGPGHLLRPPGLSAPPAASRPCTRQSAPDDPAPTPKCSRRRRPPRRCLQSPRLSGRSEPPHTRLLAGSPRRPGPGEGVTRAAVTGSTEQIRASSAVSTGPDVSLESWNPGEFLCLALHCHPQVSHFRQWARVGALPSG